MKRSIGIALVFVLGCATGGVASKLVIPPARAGTTPQRWEYLCESKMTNRQMSEAGAQGWELVTAMVKPAKYDDPILTLCFKRPLD